MTELYRPSNGTEGCEFESRFCDRCKKEKPDAEIYCDIHTNAMMFDVEDDEYPQEWRYKDGKPVCTAFEREGGA